MNEDLLDKILLDAYRAGTARKWDRIEGLKKQLVGYMQAESLGKSRRVQELERTIYLYHRHFGM